jgi:hypothetical protein
VTACNDCWCPLWLTADWSPGGVVRWDCARGLCTSFRCDQHLVGGGFEGEADAKQGSERGVAGSAAAEAEG